MVEKRKSTGNGGEDVGGEIAVNAIIKFVEETGDLTKQLVAKMDSKDRVREYLKNYAEAVQDKMESIQAGKVSSKDVKAAKTKSSKRSYDEDKRKSSAGKDKTATRSKSKMAESSSKLKVGGGELDKTEKPKNRHGTRVKEIPVIKRNDPRKKKELPSKMSTLKVVKGKAGSTKSIESVKRVKTPSSSSSSASLERAESGSDSSERVELKSSSSGEEYIKIKKRSKS